MNNLISYKKIIFILITLVATNSYAKQICKIETTVKNAFFKPSPKDHDLMAKKTAKFLNSSGLIHGCIDLRSLGSSSTSAAYGKSLLIESETIGFITNSAPGEKEMAALQKALCKGAGKKCKAITSYKCIDSAKLNFSHDFNTKPKKGEKSKKAEAKVGDIERFPRFSMGCVTGKHKDSWNDTASSQGAKKLIKQVGLNYEDIRSLSLVSEGKNFWSFGFPNHEAKTSNAQKPKHPVKAESTEEDGAL